MEFPKACQYKVGDPVGKQLFAIYNLGGPENARGIAWDGRDVPSWEEVTDQVREKWTDLARTIHFEGILAVKAEAAELKPLDHGHAWLLGFLFEHFKTDNFTFNPEKCLFACKGKGIKAEREAENIRKWFADCVDHRAIQLASQSPVEWCVAMLPQKNGDLTLSEGQTIEALARDFAKVYSEDVVKTARVIAIKGNGIPDGFGDALNAAFRKIGAPQDLLIILLPKGVDLSMVPEKGMKAKGWVRKPKLWTPGRG